MKATETSRLYNFMKAKQMQMRHRPSVIGCYHAKAPGKRLKLRWQMVEFNPNVYISQD